MPDDDPNTAAPTDSEREEDQEGERWPGDPGEGVEPSYVGEWKTLSHSQQSAYMNARKAWKATQGATDPPGKERDGSGRSVERPSAQTSPADRLRHEMEHAALPSDRIRAADALARIERAEAEGMTDEVALWLARRDTLLTLPPAQRLDWLLGQMRDEEEGGDTPTDVDEDDEGHDILPP